MSKIRVRLKPCFSSYHLKICFLVQIVYILSCTWAEATKQDLSEYALVESKQHHHHHHHKSNNIDHHGHNHNHHRRSRSHYYHNNHNHYYEDELRSRDRKRTPTTTSSDAVGTANNNSSGEAAAAVVQRDYMAAVIGKDVQLDCRMKNIPREDGGGGGGGGDNNDDDEDNSSKIVWLKMPKGEVLTLNANRVTSDARVTTRCVAHASPCWSLIITGTRETDTGFYVCQTNAMQTKYVYLDIMVPPKLLTQYPVDRIDVNQSTNATITCEFYGKPDPLIKWYKYNNGVQKEIEKFRGSKTINVYIHKDSASEYECVADNSIPPTVSKKIYLNIQYSPQIKFLNSKVFQKKGERVIFDCNVNSNPMSKIYWFKNQTRIYESYKFNFENLDDSYHRLYINNLTDGDFGDYYCTAVNMLGKSTSKIQLIELRPSIEHKKPMGAISSSSSSSPFQWSTISSASSTTTELVDVPPSSSVTANLNETVIRISLNRDNNNNNYYNTNSDVYDSVIIEDRKQALADLSSTRVKDAAKLAPTYRSNKHHLHNNRTKTNQRKQIQKPYMNSSPSKHNHQTLSSGDANPTDSSSAFENKAAIVTLNNMRRLFYSLLPVVLTTAILFYI